MIGPREYFGDFWIPSDDSAEQPLKMRGRIKITKGECSILELSDCDIIKVLFNNGNISVIWGILFNNVSVSLFDVRFHQQIDNALISFSVRYTLWGYHVLSSDTPAFTECVVKYPYLHNWASTNRLSLHQENGRSSIVIDETDMHSPLVDSELESGERAMIFEYISTRIFPFKREVEQSSYIKFQTESIVSINHFFELIVEFTQFVSIAQYFQQHPTEIIFRVKGVTVHLFYSVEPSDKPRQHALIQFPELKDRLPDMMKRWHSNYIQISPICRYLIQSSRYNAFDFPDFLIIAHALEGYHKRFINKKKGSVDKRKYKAQVEVLLDRFKDVEVIKRINIDTEVLTQSRDKYSHLIPDDEKPLAVEGRELYILTQKCKVLLTCCILDLLGLTIEEINMCCEKSDIRFMADIT